jgi:hypothetical protein
MLKINLFADSLLILPQMAQIFTDEIHSSIWTIR